MSFRSRHPPLLLTGWRGIWFFRSPVHNHADSHAVIKVLHGKIKAYYFTSLYDAQPIGPPANLEKGDITWIDPKNYQVHMLSNESGSLIPLLRSPFLRRKTK